MEGIQKVVPEILGIIKRFDKSLFKEENSTLVSYKLDNLLAI